MKPIRKEPVDYPSVEQLAAELKRVKYRSRYRAVLRSTLYMLIVVAAVAVLVATIWMPVLQIYGGSMTPTLNEGDIVVSVKGSDFEPGDLVAFYLGNKILVKRCIAGPGQWVDIDESGNVYVDGKLLEEPYLTEKSLGGSNIELPYPVLLYGRPSVHLCGFPAYGDRLCVGGTDRRKNCIPGFPLARIRKTEIGWRELSDG